MLLTKQSDVGQQRGMPVDSLSQTRFITSVSGETVQLYYYNAGVLTADAGQAAGTLVVGKLAYGPILDDMGAKVANKDNKSLSFTCLAFTTEKEFDWVKFEQSFDTSGTTLLQNVCAGFANGEYVVDYRTGTIYGKKATTAITMTSTAYKVPADALVDTSGNQKITMGTLIAGEDTVADVLKVEERYTFQNVTADTLVKTGAGFLHTLTFAQSDAAPTAGTIIFYDNTAESGTVILTVNFTTAVFQPYTLVLDVSFSNGLYIGFTTTADVNVTASYR